jgi:hypothetical protein
MPHLKKQGAIAKSIATFHTLRATDAKPFIDRVFVIRIFDKCSLNGSSGAQAVLCASVQVIWLGLEVAGAKLAVPADGIGVNALDGGLLQHTMRRTVTAPNTFLWVNLPYGRLCGAVLSKQSYQATQAGQSGGSRPVS